MNIKSNQRDIMSSSSNKSSKKPWGRLTGNWAVSATLMLIIGLGGMTIGDDSPDLSPQEQDYKKRVDAYCRAGAVALKKEKGSDFARQYKQACRLQEYIKSPYEALRSMGYKGQDRFEERYGLTPKGFVQQVFQNN